MYISYEGKDRNSVALKQLMFIKNGYGNSSRNKKSRPVKGRLFIISYALVTFLFLFCFFFAAARFLSSIFFAARFVCIGFTTSFTVFLVTFLIALLFLYFFFLSGILSISSCE